MNLNCNFQQPFCMYHLQNYWTKVCGEILSLPYIGPIQHVMRHPRWTKWHCNKLFSEFLLLSPASNRSTTAPYPPSSPLAVWHTPDSEALWHILGLWAGGFISAVALGWLQRAALLNRRDKGVKEWGFTGLENRKCVSNYCHVRCNQFQPCKFDSNLHALYGQKRESRHLQSWNRIHYIWLLWNVSHCADVKCCSVPAVCQTDIGRLIDQSEDYVLFTFSLSYPFCVLLLKWSSHPYTVDKPSTYDNLMTRRWFQIHGVRLDVMFIHIGGKIVLFWNYVTELNAT